MHLVSTLLLPLSQGTIWEAGAMGEASPRAEDPSPSGHLYLISTVLRFAVQAQVKLTKQQWDRQQGPAALGNVGIEI